jgi:hypothetical protein
MKKIFTIFAVAMFTALNAMAQLPYNTTMTSDHYNDATIVQSKGDNGWDGGIRCGNKDLGGFDYNDKYVVIALSSKGIPAKITCKSRAESVQGTLFPPTDIVFYIAWSADNSSFTTLETKESKTNSFDVALPKEAKYIKLCYSGNFAGFFTDIVVSELVYCNAPEHDVWEPTDTIGAEPMLGETTMAWGNTEPFELTLTGDGASQFTVAIDNNASKGREGVALLSAIYKNDVAGVHEAVLTIANGTYSYTINLKGTTLKKTQEIVWVLDTLVMTVGDTLELAALATSGLEVSYETDVDSVVLLEAGKMVALNSGEVVVTAKQEGDATYEAAEVVAYTITVVAADDDEDDDVSTGFENVFGEQVKVSKIVRDGKIYIIRGEQMYDMLGNRL